ncbi:MAG TPA: VTT domain-containing protein, partial [Fredinandcohnia sp.]|nr:VTT domain-containing protein [Fredinandcohnia sp.]
RWMSLEKIQKIEESWRRRGDVLILFNRFIPGIRGLFFVAAGMGRIHFRRVMLLGAVSASLWNALLLGVGYLVGANLEELQRILATYSALAWSVLGLLFLLFVGRVIWRRRRERRREERTCPR